MAKKPSQKASATKVTRIKASDDRPRAKKPATRSNTKTSKSSTKTTKSSAVKSAPATTHRFGLRRRTDDDAPRRNFLGPVGRYFAGSWNELRQVRWPDRRSTWSMTGALLAFTTFFVIVILLLDAGFQYLFKLILG